MEMIMYQLLFIYLFLIVCVYFLNIFVTLAKINGKSEIIMYIHKYIHTYIHTYTYTYIEIYIGKRSIRHVLNYIKSAIILNFFKSEL